MPADERGMLIVRPLRYEHHVLGLTSVALCVHSTDHTFISLCMPSRRSCRVFVVECMLELWVSLRHTSGLSESAEGVERE